MMLRTRTLIILMLIALIVFCSLVTVRYETSSDSPVPGLRNSPPGLPASSNPDEFLVEHSAFVLSYNEKHEQPSWVSYLLTRERTIALYKRSDRFVPDPSIPTGSATNADYQKSGFDRGHLAPAADMSWSQVAMRESFFYSNMSPQLPGFNRGIWKKLEEQVRGWALRLDTIYVVTGGVLREGLPTIGVNRVSVPDRFYKVLYHPSKRRPMGIGFIIPNASSSEPLYRFAVPIDSVEKVTGIDFFSLLPDSLERRVESRGTFWMQ